MRLDTDVPNELLSEMASYLTFNDFNSLIQTSKSLYSRLDLPKQIVNLDIDFETGAQKRIDFNVQMKQGNSVRDGDSKRWEAKLYIKPKNPKQKKSYTDQEKADLVSGFYHSKRGEKQKCLKRSFTLGHGGLASHLHFVFSNLQIDKLTLGACGGRLNNVHIVSITEVMKQYSVKVDNLHIYQRVNQKMIDLIVACKPKHLTVRCSDIPDGFCHLQVIRKLKSFIINTWRTIDIDIFSLEATVLDITSRSRFQITDAQKYLTQWTEKKRDIQTFFFRMEFNNNVDDLELLLSVTDNNLATVSQIEESRNRVWDGRFSFRITRISDNVTLSVFRFYNTLTFSLHKH